ncbi:tenascin-X [Acrasis kona]|uniref:Tenascin-X n=1 Tax=Acrasis kona TaxID=1008807 RepID=A0AAW2ZNB1_9EUKA
MDSCTDGYGNTEKKCVQVTLENSSSTSDIKFPYPSGATNLVGSFFSNLDSAAVYVIFGTVSVYMSGQVTKNSTQIQIGGLSTSGDDAITFNNYVSSGSSSAVITFGGVRYTSSSGTLCSTGYSGTNCDVTTCGGVSSTSNRTCSARGFCSGYNSCICDKDFVGSNCEVPICYGIYANNSRVCHGLGRCVSNNTCICNNGTRVINNQCEPFVQNYLGIIIGVSIAGGILILLVVVVLTVIIVCGCVKRTSSEVNPTKWKPTTPASMFDLKRKFSSQFAGFSDLSKYRSDVPVRSPPTPSRIELPDSPDYDYKASSPTVI